MNNMFRERQKKLEENKKKESLSNILSEGDNLYEKSKYQEALEEYKKVINVDPNKLHAWAMMYKIYNDLENENEAKRCLQECERIDPNFSREKSPEEIKIQIEENLNELQNNSNFLNRLKEVVDFSKDFSEISLNIRKLKKDFDLNDTKENESFENGGKLKNLLKNLNYSDLEAKTKTLENKLDSLKKDFQNEYIKFQNIFTLLQQLKEDKERENLSKTVCSKLNVASDFLNLFGDDIKEEKKEEEKIEKKPNVEVGDILTKKRTPKIFPKDPDEKPISTIINTTKLGIGNNLISDENTKNLLIEKYKKIKNFSNSWQSASLSQINNWARANKGKLSNIEELIAIMDRGNNLLTEGHVLRDTQIISILFFINTKPNEGRLCQISTGEGKTTIVSLLAVIKVFQGHQVDVISSNSVLAEEGVRDRKEFYNLFNVSVDHNNVRKNEKYIWGEKNCYKADVVYGSISNFQFDYLRDSFESLETKGDRKFDVVILDEVDSMLIDNGGNTAKLSGPLPGMESFRYIYIKIWEELTKATNDIFAEFEKTQNRDLLKNIATLAKIRVMANLQDLNKLEDLIPFHLKEYSKKKINKWVDNAIFAKFDCSENKNYIIRRKNESEKNDGKEQVDEMDTNEVTDEEQNNEKIIIPVDYLNTGVSLQNTIWSDGLHQFVQLKHNLRLTAENLTSSFISNLGYINKYGDKIFGLTGTLGSIPEQELLSSVYNIDYAVIPTYKFKKFEENPGSVFNDSEWALQLSISVGEIIESDRSVLIVCETIADALKIEELVLVSKNKNIFKISKIKKFTNEGQSEVTHEIVDIREVIIATNIAGRGTDLKTSKKLEEKGGLHVCVGFLPCNKRVEDQAFGRTSRQGNNGTAEIIAKVSEIDKLCDVTEIRHFEIIKLLRDYLEKERIKKIKEKRIGELIFKDELFSKFSEIYSKYKKEKEGNSEWHYYLNDLKEYWAFWLDELKDDKMVLDKKSAISLAESKFQEFKNSNIFKKIIEGNVEFNPYYAIGLSEYYLYSGEKKKAEKTLKKTLEEICQNNTAILYSAYMRLFEIEMDKGNVLQERFKKALASVFFIPVEQNEDYKEKSRQYLKKAEECVLKEINYINNVVYEGEPSNEKLNTNFEKILTSDQMEKSEKEGIKNIFLRHLFSRLTGLDIHLNNIKHLHDEIKNEAYVINSRISDFFKNQIKEDQNIKKGLKRSELDELKFIYFNVSYNLKPIYEVSEVIITGVKVQMGIGIACLAAGLAFPPILPVMGAIAGACISEAVCDIVIALLESGDNEFDTKSYVEEKSISYGVSIATFGISAVATSIKLLSKISTLLKKVIAILQKSPFMKNLCKKLAVLFSKLDKFVNSKILILANNLNKAQKFSQVMKSLTREVVTGLVSDLAIQKGVSELLQEILKSLKPKILKSVEPIVRQNIDKEKLSKNDKKIISDTVTLVMKRDDIESIKHVAYGIAHGVANSVKNLKIKIAIAVVDSVIKTAEIVGVAQTVVAKLNSKLTSGKEKFDGYIEDKIKIISESITDNIFSLIQSQLSSSIGLFVVNPLINKGVNKIETIIGGKNKDFKIDKGIEESQKIKEKKDLEILGLSPGATEREISRAYKKMALLHHTDKGGSKEKMQEINVAYDNLKQKFKGNIVTNNTSFKQEFNENNIKKDSAKKDLQTLILQPKSSSARMQEKLNISKKNLIIFENKKNMEFIKKKDGTIIERKILIPRRGNQSLVEKINHVQKINQIIAKDKKILRKTFSVEKAERTKKRKINDWNEDDVIQTITYKKLKADINDSNGIAGLTNCTLTSMIIEKKLKMTTEEISNKLGIRKKDITLGDLVENWAEKENNLDVKRSGKLEITNIDENLKNILKNNKDQSGILIYEHESALHAINVKVKGDRIEIVDAQKNEIPTLQKISKNSLEDYLLNEKSKNVELFLSTDKKKPLLSDVELFDINTKGVNFFDLDIDVSGPRKKFNKKKYIDKSNPYPNQKIGKILTHHLKERVQHFNTYIYLMSVLKEAFGSKTGIVIENEAYMQEGQGFKRTKNPYNTKSIAEFEKNHQGMNILDIGIMEVSKTDAAHTFGIHSYLNNSELDKNPIYKKIKDYLESNIGRTNLLVGFINGGVDQILDRAQFAVANEILVSGLKKFDPNIIAQTMLDGVQSSMQKPNKNKFKTHDHIYQKYTDVLESIVADPIQIKKSMEENKKLIKKFLEDESVFLNTDTEFSEANKKFLDILKDLEQI